MEKLTYKIKNYNLDNIQAGIVTVIGMRASGKSTLVKDILFQKRGNTIARIFNRNDNFYSDLCNRYSISTSYNSYLLMEVLDKQKVNNKEMQIVVFDDVLSSKSEWINDKNIIELLEKSKELNILAIFCFQFSLSPPNFLEHVDYVFLMEESITHNKKRLYTHYGSIFPTFEDFDKVLTKVFNRNNFNSVVIENKLLVYKYKSSNIDFKNINIRMK